MPSKLTPDQERALSSLSGEEELKLIADALPVLVSYVGPDLRYRFCNRAYEEWFHVPREKIRGLRVSELLSEEVYRIQKPHIDAVLSGQRREFSVWFERPWMGKRAASVHLVPDITEKGAVRGYISLVTDITHTKSNEEELERRVRERTGALERSQSFLDSLIEHLPNMIFVKEAGDLRFVRFNHAGEQLLGVERDQLIGKNDYDLFPKEQADFFISKDRAVLDSGKLLDIPEEPISTRSGLRYLHTRKIPLGNKDGKPEYLLGISEDITDRKLAEEELKKSQVALQSSYAELENRVQERTAQLNEAVRVRDEFLSIASHELKTPLTPLKLQLQNLVRTLNPKGGSAQSLVIPPEQLIQLVHSSDRQITRLTRLIEDLLDVSRITAGHLNLHLEEVDLSQLVSETVERYAEQFGEADCAVEIDAPKPVLGLFDRLRIEQVIVNLMTNALKYAPGKPVRFSVHKLDGRAQLSVRDQGAGIPEEQLERLFNRFERGATSAGLGGLGLGLYISRQIIQTHGGTIHIESRPGAGATFVIDLPLHP
jgi:PAS domain S-box-containing protein